MAKSIVQTDRECFACGATQGLEEHHIFYGRGIRPLAEQHGMKVYLCHVHHRDSKSGVHFNKQYDTCLKQMAQKIFERDHTREEFRAIFGRSYL